MTNILRTRSAERADPAGAGGAPTATVPGGALAPEAAPPEDAVLAGRSVHRRVHPARWILTAVVLLLVLNAGQTLFTNPAWEWPKVGTWIVSAPVLKGLRLTLLATAISAVVSLAGGILVAVARLSRNPVLSSLSWVYVWVFRSLPLILVLIFLYNLGSLYPTVGIGVPFGPQFQVRTVSVLSDLTLGVVGLSLAQIAYTSEVVRAGLLSVDAGQLEAAKSLGIPRGRRFRRILLPQALRSIVPAFVNQIVGLLQASSLLFYVSLLDLFGVVQNLGSTYPTDIIPLLVVASIWYLVFTSVIGIAQFYIERFYARGAAREVPLTPFQRVRRAFRVARPLEGVR